MITLDEFSNVLKYINNANQRLDILMESKDTNDIQRSWLEAIQKDLNDLTDYIVDDIKIKE